MLDYKKLSQQADKLFDSFSKEDLEEWIALDEQRSIEELNSEKAIKPNVEICDTKDKSVQ